jgi:excisionase family DNA binding protein
MRRGPKRPATTAEAAAHYGVTVRTVRRWYVSGLITAYRVGPRLVRVDLDEIEQLAKVIPAAKAAS